MRLNLTSLAAIEGRPAQVPRYRERLDEAICDVIVIVIEVTGWVMIMKENG
jgi:hypothetical protein